MQDAVLEFAQASCLELAAGLLHRLPRELRDMVYVQLWNRISAPFWNMMWPCNEHDWTAKCSGPPCTCLRALPHFIDLNFMGAQVATEVLQTFKTVAAEYDYQYTIQASEIEHFAKADVFHVGITREELFRGLDLILQCSHFIYGEEDAYELVKHIIEKELEEFVQFVLNIPFDGPRLLTFAMAHGHEDPVNLEQVMRALSPAFRGMKLKGCDVQLHYTNYELDIDWKLGADAWDWTPDDWKRNMRKLGDLNVVLSEDAVRFTTAVLQS